MARKYQKKKAIATSAIDKKQERQITKIYKKLQAVAPQTKWAEYTSTSAVANYNGLLISFNEGIAQGTGDYGVRIGDQITMKGLRLRFQPNTYGYALGCSYRIIVFQYLKDPDGATSTASLINLLLHSAQVGTVLAPQAPYDHDNRTCFKVLYDKNFTINPTTMNGVTQLGISRTHKINIRFKEGSKNSKVQYFNAGTTTTKNELFALVISDSSSSLGMPYVGHLYYTSS